MFYGCKNLSQVLGLDKTRLIKIPRMAFYNCTSLKSITLFDGISEIGEMPDIANITHKRCCSLAS